MNKINFLVSIIVPIYNQEKRLENCINSLINQSYKNIEIILIDDGSTDNTSTICKKYLDMDNRIRYYYQKNAGASAARNTGLKKMHGHYFTFVDSDDYVDMDYIETMICSMINDNADIVISKVCNNIKRNGKREKEFINNDEAMKMLLIDSFSVESVVKLYDRKTFNNIYYNESISNNEDKLYIFECLKKATKCIIIDYYGYHYVDNDNSLSKRINIKALKGMLFVANKINDYSKEKYPEYANIPIAITTLRITKNIINSKKNREFHIFNKTIINNYKKLHFNYYLIPNKIMRIELMILHHSYILFFIIFKIVKIFQIDEFLKKKAL